MHDGSEKPTPGVAQALAPDLHCVLAPNPSPMTYWGTNTYLLGHDSLAVIDPGPDDPAHLEALLAAIDGRTVSHILVTHAHVDHSPLARPLAQATGAPILAFGPAEAGRSTVMQTLADSGLLGGGEGVDRDFQPDRLIGDGDVIDGDGWQLTALHTPGHMGNHLCFLWGDSAFAGDHVMGWASSLVSPPDGDLTDFMASCTRLAATGVRRLFAGHGAPVEDAQTRIADLIAHRRDREAQILAALRDGAATAKHLTTRIYSDVPAALLPAAERNVLAHLVDLFGRNRVQPQGPFSATARFALTN